MDVLSFLLLLLSVAVFVDALRLHLCISTHIKEAGNICSAHKTTLFRAAHGAIFLSAAYAIAEVRWLIMELDTKIPTLDDILWNCLEACFLLFVAWICRVGRRLITSQWRDCQL